LNFSDFMTKGTAFSWSGWMYKQDHVDQNCWNHWFHNHRRIWSRI
jgi:hypothetical protein